MKAIKLFMISFLCYVNAKSRSSKKSRNQEKNSEIQEVPGSPENLLKNSQQKLIYVNTKNAEKSAKSRRKQKNKGRKSRRRKNNRNRKHKGTEIWKNNIF